MIFLIYILIRFTIYLMYIGIAGVFLFVVALLFVSALIIGFIVLCIIRITQALVQRHQHRQALATARIPKLDLRSFYLYEQFEHRRKR